LAIPRYRTLVTVDGEARVPRVCEPKTFSPADAWKRRRRSATSLSKIKRSGSYVLQRGNPATQPDAFFAFGLVPCLAQWLNVQGGAAHAIAFAPGFPGRVFALTEDATGMRLEHIEVASDGAISFHDTMGLWHLLSRRTSDLHDVLRPRCEARVARI
jgi:rRNA maturation protein Nop10